MFKMKKKNEFITTISITIAIVLIIFFALWLLTNYWFEIPSTANEFGDSFGMTNTLFSALAFAFLIVTAQMQKKELELQRKELSETKLELKRSADAQNNTTRAMDIQAHILAKQALLSSYQSMYSVNMNIGSNNEKSPFNKEILIEEAKKYKMDMEILIEEIEQDMELFRDPFKQEKREDYRKIAKQFMQEQ